MKTGFAVLVGRSNVGKSTLLNSLVGTKVAITTPKPQTTRRPIQGVVTDMERGQIVFVDTPGIMQKSRDQLTKNLHKFVQESMEGIDVILYVVDPTRPIGAEERHIINMLQKSVVPVLLVINKTDIPSAKRNIDFYRDLKEHFTDVIEVSATRRSNLNRLTDWIFERLPEGEFMYPEFAVSNISKEDQIAELIREKLFLRLRQEVPYSVHVVVNKIHDKKDNVLYIDATIYTTEERYQGMIIGKGGSGINEINHSTSNELQAVTGRKIDLDLHVAVDPHWVTQFES